MKRSMLWLSVVYWLSSASALTAQGFYPDFALVVQLPSFETFMTNLGDSTIRVDGYQITSASGSLSPTGWVRLGASGPEGEAALGPGVSQFFAANPNINSLSELNPISSATWQSGQSWSIGFPFNTLDPTTVRDALFHFSSPNGLVLTGGTVVPPGELFRAALLVIPEPATLVILSLGVTPVFARRRKFE